ncbi:hypothetical protein [Methylibium sp.]|uniref:hypothetical protein n=1 Tax=Methylibium sp. TaxID=2067992 RepID=UPI0017CE07BD|nr:hypothetical protein [Methylibium sp.]MBA3591632.1 hypothetical protein [Methylibium sp.]
MRMPTRQLELPFTAPRQHPPLAPRGLPAAPVAPRLPEHRPVTTVPLNAAWRGRAPALPPPSILLRFPQGPTP